MTTTSVQHLAYKRTNLNVLHVTASRPRFMRRLKTIETGALREHQCRARCSQRRNPAAGFRR